MPADDGLDIVLLGATGVAGSVAAEHLARYYGDSEVSWAIAGRNEEKLRKLRWELAGIDESHEELPILVADVFDRDSLERLVSKTRVLVSTVGPFVDYGRLPLEVCLETGTDYCNVSGETPWLRRTIDLHHDEAVERGVRVVNACAVNSFPDDIGTLLLQETARRETGRPCSDVRMVVTRFEGGLSGSSAEGLARIFQARAENEIYDHPYALAPPGERSGPDSGAQTGVRYDEEFGVWTAPFLMAPMNEKIVRRSNALRDYEYGRDFTYSEATATGDGWSGRVGAFVETFSLHSLINAIRYDAIRKPLQKLGVPRFQNPGDGPSRETMEEGGFEFVFLGRADDGESRIRVTVGADAGPGYLATAKMLVESAVLLLEPPPEDAVSAGILTPAAAFGTRIVEPLRERGMTFEAEVRDEGVDVTLGERHRSWL